ncbi:hypothetical protein [Ornithinibacillus halophilus]|uniref:Uncharacterized protein n=1 Tax=Ornithinibacillus halophilus TaxID=930117 RepID=A0A1M5NGK3_9BACI|nr:hypothetical protein [Ornithinibacillus halophilus]SHG88650.1 hypothetical protein SAMN05216225_10799 [Ornithinibacillus halophilus]
MKDNKKLESLIDEIKSLPKPNYEKDFDINKQNEIHKTLMKYSDGLELKRNRGNLFKHISVGIGSMAVLLLVLVIFIPFSPNSTNNTSQINSFEAFFHQSMEEMNKLEEKHSYNLISTEFNVVHANDAIAIFTEEKDQEEQIYIAYFEKLRNQWEWNQTRGSEWNTPVNWSSMKQKPYIFSGPLSDHSIKEVYVGEEQAKIIEVNGDKRFWYAISPVEEVDVIIVTEDGNRKILEEVENENIQETYNQDPNKYITSSDNEVEAIILESIEYQRLNKWDEYVELYNYSSEVKEDLLTFLKDSNNQAKKEGIHGIQDIKVVSMELTSDSEFISQGDYVYDVLLDMKVQNPSEFYMNGVTRHVFVLNRTSEGLKIETVYFKGLVDDSE